MADTKQAITAMLCSTSIKMLCRLISFQGRVGLGASFKHLIKQLLNFLTKCFAGSTKLQHVTEFQGTTCEEMDKHPTVYTMEMDATLTSPHKKVA